jgi:hypothetical protein
MSPSLILTPVEPEIFPIVQPGPLDPRDAADPVMHHSVCERAIGWWVNERRFRRGYKREAPALNLNPIIAAISYAFGGPNFAQAEVVQ